MVTRTYSSRTSEFSSQFAGPERNDEERDLFITSRSAKLVSQCSLLPGWDRQFFRATAMQLRTIGSGNSPRSKCSEAKNPAKTTVGEKPPPAPLRRFLRKVSLALFNGKVDAKTYHMTLLLRERV